MRSKTGAGTRARLVGMAVAAVWLMAACGSGEDEPDFEVAVQVDGIADASNPLTAGESTTIEVKSGSQLAFESEGATVWLPTATDTTFVVGTDSSRSKTMTVTSHAGGDLVIVFADKDDATKRATLTIHVAAQEFQQVARVDGEVEAWTQISTDADGSVDTTHTLRRTTVLDGGGYAIDIAVAETPENPYTRGLYDAQDAYLGYINPGMATACFYDTPVVMASYPMQVGKSWSGESTRACGPQVVVQKYSRSVDAYETVTVAEGTHSALRVKTAAHYAYSFGGNPQFSFTLNSTCWWAVDLGRQVKCETVDTDDATGNVNTTSSEMTTLTR